MRYRVVEKDGNYYGQVKKYGEYKYIVYFKYLNKKWDIYSNYDPEYIPGEHTMKEALQHIINYNTAKTKDKKFKVVKRFWSIRQVEKLLNEMESK